jgi:hypothetical protein
LNIVPREPLHEDSNLFDGCAHATTAAEASSTNVEREFVLRQFAVEDCKLLKRLNLSVKDHKFTPVPMREMKKRGARLRRFRHRGLMLQLQLPDGAVVCKMRAPYEHARCPVGFAALGGLSLRPRSMQNCRFPYYLYFDRIMGFFLVDRI